MAINNFFYSQGVPKILEARGRMKIARQLRRLLTLHLPDTKKLSLLDVGCSSGIVTNHLSKYFKKTIGIDVDRDAIRKAQKRYKKGNLKFENMSAENINFKDNSFEVVVLNQTYEFVDNQQALVDEVYRVLARRGVCLVGARNKLSFLEGQTDLPLIHFLPDKIADKTAKIFGKKYYPAKYLTYWQLKSLFKKFEIHNLTSAIIKNPNKYSFESLAKCEFALKLIPKLLIESIMFLIPNYIFLCKKR